MSNGCVRTKLPSPDVFIIIEHIVSWRSKIKSRFWIKAIMFREKHIIGTTCFKCGFYLVYIGWVASFPLYNDIMPKIDGFLQGTTGNWKTCLQDMFPNNRAYRLAYPIVRVENYPIHIIYEPTSSFGIYP